MAGNWDSLAAAAAAAAAAIRFRIDQVDISGPGWTPTRLMTLRKPITRRMKQQQQQQQQQKWRGER